MGGVNILILVMMVFFVVIIFEVPGLIQKKYWKELMVFGTLLLAGFSLSLLMVLGIPLPNVSTLINQFFEKIFHM